MSNNQDPRNIFINQRQEYSEPSEQRQTRQNQQQSSEKLLTRLKRTITPTK